MKRRRLALHEVMARHGVGHALLYGAERAGSAVPWLSGWPVTREAALLVTPGEPDLLFVQFFNHVPLAAELARDAEVRWGGPDTMAAVCEALEWRAAGRPRLGVIGSLPFRSYETLARSADPVDLGAEYVSLRLRKSAEELAWTVEGARLSDLGIAALESGVRAGITEYELVDLVERAYVPLGGTTHIHYFGVTSMAEPRRAVPAQFPSGRRVRPGDALTLELSASFWGYPGQVLRTWTVEAEPTPLYRRLHDAADEALDAMLGVLRDGAHPGELVFAASVIEDAGFTTCDDLVHGFGGGYLPPVLGSPSRRHGPVPDMRLRAGMTLVLQPNVVTPDGRAGVQTGELVAVTRDGYRRLHTAPRGLRRLG
ncbi:MAG: M24 family metallopeptidase [Streptosporangiales bacterium]|nr:M24 family metallopeptidase [Streptosporangiales bacterium]